MWDFQSNLFLGTAFYLVVTLALYLISIFVPAAGFFARLLAAYASLIVCASVGVISSLILRLAGLPGISQWFVGRCFKYVMWYTTGITFTIQDPNDYLGKTRPAVFIGNHQTELDVLMLGCIFPQWCSVTAKRSLQKIPFLGWFMTLSGSVFIDRANSKNARQAMAAASEEITKKRQSVYMFPEGTRSYAKEAKLLPFKKGAFHLAVQAQVPIVPVVVANYSHILNPSTLTFMAGNVPVKVLPPIQTKNLAPTDVDDLVRDTYDLMLSELNVLTVEVRGQTPPMPALNNGEVLIEASQ